ncbi:MAG: hypothetical protein CM15mP98_07630 [Paracoccaceae bacterium]|nr:MAG: hypothetical protein CM15mP98_07630 [Paracoccaceae bacterium]
MRQELHWGVIALGRTIYKSLHEAAAALPQVEVKRPRSVGLGEILTCMQSGFIGIFEFGGRYNL